MVDRIKTTGINQFSPSLDSSVSLTDVLGGVDWHKGYHAMFSQHARSLFLCIRGHNSIYRIPADVHEATLRQLSTIDPLSTFPPGLLPLIVSFLDEWEVSVHEVVDGIQHIAEHPANDGIVVTTKDAILIWRKGQLTEKLRMDSAEAVHKRLGTGKGNATSELVLREAGVDGCGTLFFRALVEKKELDESFFISGAIPFDGIQQFDDVKNLQMSQVAQLTAGPNRSNFFHSPSGMFMYVMEPDYIYRRHYTANHIGWLHYKKEKKVDSLFSESEGLDLIMSYGTSATMGNFVVDDAYGTLYWPDSRSGQTVNCYIPERFRAAVTPSCFATPQCCIITSPTPYLAIDAKGRWLFIFHCQEARIYRYRLPKLY